MYWIYNNVFLTHLTLPFGGGKNISIFNVGVVSSKKLNLVNT